MMLSWTPPAPDADAADVRRRLGDERESALARLASLTGDFDAVVAASLDSNADDEHDPEGHTIAFERSQIGAIVTQVRHHLAELDAALDRVDAGTYGTCESCGGPIGAYASTRSRPRGPASRARATAGVNRPSEPARQRHVGERRVVVGRPARALRGGRRGEPGARRRRAA